MSQSNFQVNIIVIWLIIIKKGILGEITIILDYNM